MALVPSLGWAFGPRVALALATILAVGSLGLELARRTSPLVDDVLWGHAPGLFKPWERRGVLESTWFVATMLVVLLFFGPAVGGMAVLFLALGDPAAELVGRRWGERGLRKTWAGSLACLTACLVSSLAAGPCAGLPPATAVPGAVAAAVAERWSPPPTDNVWIPVFSALVMTACGRLAVA